MLKILSKVEKCLGIVFILLACGAVHAGQFFKDNNEKNPTTSKDNGQPKCAC